MSRATIVVMGIIYMSNVDHLHLMRKQANAGIMNRTMLRSRARASICANLNLAWSFGRSGFFGFPPKLVCSPHWRFGRYGCGDAIATGGRARASRNGSPNPPSSYRKPPTGGPMKMAREPDEDASPSTFPWSLGNLSESMLIATVDTCPPPPPCTNLASANVKTVCSSVVQISGVEPKSKALVDTMATPSAKTGCRPQRVA